MHVGRLMFKSRLARQREKPQVSSSHPDTTQRHEHIHGPGH